MLELLLEDISQAFSFAFRVTLIGLAFTTVFDILTDWLTLHEFAMTGQKWWTAISFMALYYSNRLGLYRWARASYRVRDYRMFAGMTEMKLDWTLLVHGTPLLGPLVDMFWLNKKDWKTRAKNSFIVAVWLCIETEIILSFFSWFYIFVVFYEICNIIPTWWKNLKNNYRAKRPAELIVIPALEIFEAFPQIAIQFRAYYDPEYIMDSTIFTLSATFSIIGLVKAIVVFLYYYPVLKQGVYRVYNELDFSWRGLTSFPALDGDDKIVRELFLGGNPGFDVFSIPPMPVLERLRLNSCNLKSLTPKIEYIISLNDVSKFAANIGWSNTASLAKQQMPISTRFPLLKHLDLSGNIGFDTDTIPAIPLLNTLSLSKCGLVTLGYKSWSERFPRLELLEIHKNPNLDSLEKLNPLRKANNTMLALDKEQTILPGFQIATSTITPTTGENHEIFISSDSNLESVPVLHFKL